MVYVDPPDWNQGAAPAINAANLDIISEDIRDHQTRIGTLEGASGGAFEWHYQFTSDGLYQELWIDPHTILAAPSQSGPGTFVHRRWGPNRLVDVSAFNTANWIKSGTPTVDPDVVNDPSGNLVADRLNASANTDELRQSYATGGALAGQTWVARVFLYAPVSHAVRLLIDGTGGTTPAGNASPNVNTPIGTEWQEYTLEHTFDANTTWTNVRFRLFPSRSFSLGDTTGLNYSFAADASLQFKQTLSTYPVSIAGGDVTEFEVSGVDSVRPKSKLVAVKLQRA